MCAARRVRRGTPAAVAIAPAVAAYTATPAVPRNGSVCALIFRTASCLYCGRPPSLRPAVLSVLEITNVVRVFPQWATALCP